MKAKKEDRIEVPKLRKKVTAADAAQQEVSRALTIVKREEQALIMKPANAGDLTIANGQFQRLKTAAKELKARKESITTPLNAALTNVRNLFKPAEEQLASLIECSKDGINAYNAEAQKKLEALREKLDERLEDEDDELTQVSANRRVLKAAAKLGVDNIPTVTTRVMEIFDPEKVPARYWVIDEVALRKDLITGREVPGARLIEKTSVKVG